MAPLSPIQHVPAAERLSVGLALALSGGFLESYSYLCRDRVFANAQTGNLALLSIALSQGHWRTALRYLLPILCFVIGIFYTEWIKTHSAHAPISWQQRMLLAEGLMLLAVGFLPTGPWNLAATTLIAFTCAIQADSFRRLYGSAYATTMCTGNLRSAAENLYGWLSRHDPEARKGALRYGVVILVFMAGAALGALCTQLWGIRAVWLCFLPLAAAFWQTQPTPHQS